MMAAATTNARTTREWAPAVGVAAALLASVLWCFWATARELYAFWLNNEDYSVGMLVPPAAVFLVWHRRRDLPWRAITPCWWGLGAVIAAQGMRLFGLYYGLASAERYALVVTLGGLVLLLLGRRLTWNLRWVVVFLLLMVPFPARVHEAIALPLQSIATSASVFFLELLGFYVARQGNVLQLDDRTVIAVAEACSGLRMLTAFIFVVAVLSLVLRRPAWQKFALVAFSVPLALVSNVVRVVATSFVVYHSADPAIEERFHDIAGLMMMPLAIIVSLAFMRFMGMIQQSPPQSNAPAAAGPRSPHHAARRRRANRHEKPESIARGER